MSEKVEYSRERKTKSAEQALVSLMRYAARAERSSGDAMRLMRNWGVPEADRQKVLDELMRLKFIDDQRFAEAYVRDKVRLAGWGVYKIRSGLIAKGISKELIEQALAQIEPEDTEERLAQLLERKLRSVKGGTPYERRTKLVRYGLSRGFTYGEVSAAVSALTGIDGEDDGWEQ